MKAENREMLLVNTGLVQVESLKVQKKNKFLGMLLTAAGLPSKCTEFLFANLYLDVYCKIGTGKYPGLI